MPIPARDGDALQRDSLSDAPDDTYGLIAADSKAQTVAEAVSLFTRRLCASLLRSDFSKKTGKRTLRGE
jgi:hypothetical protein